MKFSWVNGTALAKEIREGIVPGADEVCFRRGTVNSWTGGLAISRNTRLDFFEGGIDTDIIKRVVQEVAGRYVRLASGKGSLILKLRPSHHTEIYKKEIEFFIDFNLWDRNIDWQQCPQDLVEGIAFIENSRINGAVGSDERIFAGIHIDGNYVGRLDGTSCSRFRLRFPVPFSMILSPAGIGRMRFKLKDKQLSRVARYVIPDIGPGVIFDYGNLRVWNADLEPEQDRYSDLRDFVGRKPKNEIEKEMQESLRSARDWPPPQPRWENLILLINKYFDFRIDNLMEPPEDVRPILQLIKRNADKEITWVKFGRDKIKFSWFSEGHIPDATIPAAEPHSRQPISFGINLFDFERLIRRGTYLGFENPDSPGKDYGFLYLKDRQGEHLIPIFYIHKGAAITKQG